MPSVQHLLSRNFLCSSKSGLGRLINLCLSLAADIWHFTAAQGGERESYILYGKIILGQHQRSTQTS